MEIRPTGMLTAVETSLKLNMCIAKFYKFINLGIIKSRKKIGRVYFYDLEAVKKEIQKWADKK